MIEFSGVGLRVPAEVAGEPDKVLLHDIDCTLAERRVAVVGANGSGKSTLLRLVNGLRAPTAGTVTVDGLDTVAKAKAVRKAVGFVFTDPLSQLLMSTPVEDVELSLRATVRDRKERRRRALELLEARGLAHVADQSVYDLSGGERQLVALTSVLAVEPSVIVADEPTTLLDLRNRTALARVFADLPQQLLYSTHDLDFAALADRVLVVDGGTIVADDVPARAIAHYRDLMA